MALDVAKVGVVVFLAAIVQVSIVSAFELGNASPDLLLVTLVCVALLRGSMYGAVAGFFAGLVVDTATLQTLGLTSLLLTTAGYWIGRYGETTGRDRSHAPLLSVAVITVLYALGALVLHFLLGETAPGRAVLGAIVPAVALNLVLAVPVYAICRRILGRPAPQMEVRLLAR